MIPAGQDWPPKLIQGVLEVRGTSIEKLEKENGYRKGTLRNVFHRHWPKGERVVAGGCGVSPETIWPSRFKEVGPAVSESASAA